MTNPYDPDPLHVEEEPTVSRGLAFWLFACALVTIAAVMVAALLLATPVRAAPLRYDGLTPRGEPAAPMAVEENVGTAFIPAPFGVLPDTATAVSGTATWYCSRSSACTRGYPASGLYAAAGSELRRWRGEFVRVRANGRSVVVRLIDVCACPGARVIDLYRGAFARLASPSRGVIRVTVELERALPLPPTSTK